VLRRVAVLKVITEGTGAFYQHYPRAATIITSSHGGRKNAMAVAWHSPVSFKPALYGIAIAPKRYTYSLISESKQFGVNFMPFEKISTIAAVGGSSGTGINKFTEFNLAEDSPMKTDVPILRDAYAAYECRVIENKIFGDHAWITGEIVAVHVDDRILNDRGVLELGKVKPALYLGGDCYCSTDNSSSTVLDRDRYGKI
jgi:flavin reductase (DIM6/NTAB) family NADH-FMN oxidoreductase RutF